MSRGVAHESSLRRFSVGRGQPSTVVSWGARRLRPAFARLQLPLEPGSPHAVGSARHRCHFADGPVLRRYDRLVDILPLLGQRLNLNFQFGIVMLEVNRLILLGLNQ